MEIPKDFLKPIIRQAESEYPRECCGVILGKPGRPLTEGRLQICRNAQDDYHQKNPESFPRTSRQAYLLDPKELFEINRSLRSRGEQILLIYHSHIDAPAFFSGEDARMAVSAGEPVYPGADYLVAAVKAGKVYEANLFRWDSNTKKYGFFGRVC